MAEVKWQARRVSDGVLVDVTGDTTGTPASAPTENALEAGGTGATIQWLGPYRVNFNDSLANPGKLLTTLSAGTLVLMSWIEVITAWNANPATAMLTIMAGGADHASGDMRQSTRGLVGSDETELTTTHQGGAAYEYIALETHRGRFQPIRIITAGALRAIATNTAGATTGAADVYALIVEPA